MANGDSLIGDIGYEQLLITPFPTDSSKFYLFNLSSYTYPGLYYNVIDMNQDTGRGAIMQKNIQLNDTNMFYGISAMKQGNGRDWWIVGRPCYLEIGGTPTNEFYLFSVSPAGIQGPFIQTVGDPGNSVLGSLRFSHRGDKIVYADPSGLLELYDFDRCTGIISNPLSIKPAISTPPYPWTVGAEFSPNDSVLYTSSQSTISRIFQYDLTAANITSSEQIIAAINYPVNEGGFLRLAPDNKIYWSFAWHDGMNFNYPYSDSSIAYNMYNMNLSVINNPNALGTTCDFQPFSFYLGGKRTYYDLPNNPDYNLPALGGSLCDTLGYPNQVKSIESKSTAQLNVFYHPDWQTAFINASGLSGRNYGLHIVDITGKEVFSESGSLTSQYYTKDLRCDNFTAGTYIVLLETEKERLVKKLIVE